MREMLQCSLCGGDLSRGLARVRRSLPTWLSWLLPRGFLEFRPDTRGRERVRIAREGIGTESFLCEDCGSVTLTSRAWVAPGWARGVGPQGERRYTSPTTPARGPIGFPDGRLA